MLEKLKDENGSEAKRMDTKAVEFAMTIQEDLIRCMSGDLQDGYIKPDFLDCTQHRQQVSLFLGFEEREDTEVAANHLRQSGYTCFVLAEPMPDSEQAKLEQARGLFYGGRLVVLS